MKRVLSAMVVSMLCAVSCARSEPEIEPAEDEDDSVGAVIDTPDPSTGPDACVDLDLCDVVVEGPLDADETAPSDPEPVSEAYVAGAHFLTRTYANLRKYPSADAGVVKGIEPHGGVDGDHIHQWGNPAGMLSPAQKVTLVDQQPKNGFYKVKYDDQVGWIGVKKLIPTGPGMHPVTFALKHPNMFFKHQNHRNLWNKDGPSGSGSCAPTSLAMAARILGREPAGLSVEESIHRIRRLYEHPIDEASETAGTTRAEIYKAATSKALDLSVHPMTKDYSSPANALEAIDNQLAKKRLVVLEGHTGSASSVYRKAFDEIYRAAEKAGKTLFKSSYEFGGKHSILVLGRDAKGRYVVGDPMSEVGFVVLGAAAMKDFMTRFIGHRGTGNAVWVD
jgi:hypothetical protein